MPVTETRAVSAIINKAYISGERLNAAIAMLTHFGQARDAARLRSLIAERDRRNGAAAARA